MMASLRTIFTHAAGLLGLARADPMLRTPAAADVNALQLADTTASSYFYEPLSGAPSCPIDGPVSCHNSTPVDVEGSCCFVHPGGRILLTQFWDEQVHAGGAEKAWTLHGLWPDLCDGTYDQFCNMAPRHSDIAGVLRSHEQHELLAYMDRHWLAKSGPNARLWAHEYNKHATCVNTLAPRCYGAAHRPGLEVVDYFVRATALFRGLDTYGALAAAGIVPHARTHYPLRDVQDALERHGGGRVVLRCSRRGGGGAKGNDVLHEAWWVFFVRGSLQTGEFVPATDLGREGAAGNCAPWVRYLPKGPVRGSDMEGDAEEEEDGEVGEEEDL